MQCCSNLRAKAVNAVKAVKSLRYRLLKTRNLEDCDPNDYDAALDRSFVKNSCPNFKQSHTPC